MLRLGVTLAAALLLLSPSANAQPGKKVAKIGIVSASGVTDHFDAFRRGLSELGWIDGQNVRIEYRYAEHQPERLPGLIAELIEAKVDVLLCASTVTVLAAKRVTTTVPVVFASVFDPVASGIVGSLSRPGGNITGATIGVGGSGTAGKWLELAKELVPGATRVAVFHNSRNPASAQSVREIQSAAKRLDTRLDMLDVA
ncbi:MAG TPA: ABC transporter substrate-binding protein, partial [Casimicrobiaceae bacterium]|nr:ABC transporter substrate-binding protein [Casimicrobiaceae bacterium]